MEYNILSNLQYCKDIVDSVNSLLLYSHVPTAIIVVAVALFVYFKNRDLLLSKILLFIAIAFAAWSTLDLVIWFNYDKASVVMAAWAPIEIFSVLLFILSFYFVYVFIEGKDMSLVGKLRLFSPIFIMALLTPTTFNLTHYDLVECISAENNPYILFVRWIKILLALGVVGYTIHKLAVTKDSFRRKQIVLLAIGISSFLYAFLVSGYISEQSGDFILEMYGLFAMLIFIGTLTYLIVRYAAFNIRLLGAQALMGTLIALVGAQFFFIRTPVNMALNGVAFALSIIFGYFLVRSVENESRQRERLQMLANELQTANEKLRELDTSKSEFISLATHQIRSPLTAIQGYSSLILEGDYGEVPEQIKGVVKIIFESCHNLVTIVNEFLDISRIELGRMKYDKSNFDLTDLAKEVIEELLPNVEKAGLGIEFRHSAADKFPILADRNKMGQIISNLIDNSIKYTPHGNITVSLSKNSGKILLTVKDTGVGIDPSEKEKLFAKFTRAKDANKVNVTGTGLGLYVGKQMVEAMGGRIWFDSEGKDMGTSFFVEMPEQG